MAIISSCLLAYALLVFRELPPTPPSPVAVHKEGPGFLQGLKLMFGKANYSQICVADFLSSGPPLVFFATIDRILPASVDQYDRLAAAAGIGCAFPSAYIFSKYLVKHQTYYGTTASLYVLGFLLWAAATVCYAVGTDASELAIIGLGTLALVAFVVWSVGVYELKLEYTYSTEYSLSGLVVGIDRTIINSGTLVYVAAIPPERFDGDGRVKTMYAGLASMLVGTLLVLTIRNKYAYLRKEHESEIDTTEITADNADKLMFDEKSI